MVCMVCSQVRDGGDEHDDSTHRHIREERHALRRTKCALILFHTRTRMHTHTHTHVHMHAHLFPETLDVELAGLFIDPLPIHNVHPPQDQTGEPRQSEEHDGAASQSTAGDTVYSLD